MCLFLSKCHMCTSEDHHEIIFNYLKSFSYKYILKRISFRYHKGTLMFSHVGDPIINNLSCYLKTMYKGFAFFFLLHRRCIIYFLLKSSPQNLQLFFINCILCVMLETFHWNCNWRVNFTRGWLPDKLVCFVQCCAASLPTVVTVREQRINRWQSPLHLGTKYHVSGQSPIDFTDVSRGMQYMHKHLHEGP